MNLNDEIKAQRRRDAEEEAKLRTDLDVIRQEAIHIAVGDRPEGENKEKLWNLVGAACDVAAQIVIDVHRRLNR